MAFYATRYIIGFNNSILTIGCKQYTIKEWKEFTDDQIKIMDRNSLEWWNKWKDFIFQAIELTNNSKIN